MRGIHSTVILIACCGSPTSGVAQHFSARNDFNGALGGTEIGVGIASSDSGWTVLQAGVDTMNVFFRICFVYVDTIGSITELRSFGADSLAFLPGHGGGQQFDPSGWSVFGGVDDGDTVSAMFMRFSPELDSLGTTYVYSGMVDFASGRSVRFQDGRYAAVGAMVPTGQEPQMFLTFFDANGQILQTQEYGTALYEDAWSVDTCYDRGFVIGAHRWWSFDDQDGLVFKTDSTGDVVWETELGGPYRDGVMTVIATHDSAYMVAGSTAYYQSGAFTASRIYAARLDAAGSVIWERQYGAAGVWSGYGTTISRANNGTYILAGIQSSTGGDKGALLNINANGDSLWMRSYRHPALDSTFSIHWLRSAMQNPDGTIIATGSCNDGQQDLWVIRVDSFGCLVPGCQLYDHISEGPRGSGIPELSILAYPNPVRDHLYISFRSDAPANGAFRLFDASGKQVRRFTPGGRSEEIDLDLRPHGPGLYVLIYQDGYGTRWSQRIVIE